MSEVAQQPKTKKIKVILNYNHFEEKFHDVPENWTDKQISAKVTKKYGQYDVKEWVHV